MAERAAKEEAESKWRELAAGLTWGQQQPGASGIPGVTAEDGSRRAGNVAGIARQSSSALPHDPFGNNATSSHMSSVTCVPAAPQDAASAELEEPHVELEMECVICLFRPKQTCCIPCGHVCMVRGCLGLWGRVCAW